jgi:hypothetical protein
MSTDDQRKAAELHGEALLAAQHAVFRLLMVKLADPTVSPDQRARIAGELAATAFTPVVIRSSTGRESVRVCGRSIDVATDEAHAGREQPDEPGGEP